LARILCFERRKDADDNRDFLDRRQLYRKLYLARMAVALRSYARDTSRLWPCRGCAGNLDRRPRELFCVGSINEAPNQAFERPGNILFVLKDRRRVSRVVRRLL